MKNPPTKRNKFETQAQVAEGLRERWVRKNAERNERDGEQTRKCVRECPSACMAFCEWIKVKLQFSYCEWIKVKLQFSYVTDYKIKNIIPL
jgi:hypothetical protein